MKDYVITPGDMFWHTTDRVCSCGCAVKIRVWVGGLHDPILTEAMAHQNGFASFKCMLRDTSARFNPIHTNKRFWWQE